MQSPAPGCGRSRGRRWSWRVAGSGSRLWRAAAAAAVALSGLLATTGCAARVGVPAAPSADDPLCASVVLALPDSLDGLPRVGTTSQATAAWGRDGQPVTVRCGVEPPGPTAEECVRVTDPSGVVVDWISVQREDGGWTMTTYGRDPAVEVSIPADRSTAPLVELNAAVALSPAERECL